MKPITPSSQTAFHSFPIFLISVDFYRYDHGRENRATRGPWGYSMRAQSFFQAVALSFAATMLVACGGGSGSIGGGTGTTTGTTTGGTPGGTTGDTTGGVTTPVYRAGFLSGTSFNDGQIFVESPSLAAGGQTALRVDIVDSTGTRLNGVSATVTFTSSCFSAGSAQLNPAAVTTTTGRADTTYVAKGCSGTDSIQASVVVSTVTTTLTAVGSVSVQAAEVGSIQPVSATPGVIGLTGTSIASQSTVVFKVVDGTGGVVTGQTVTFQASTTVGGISLLPASAKTDSQGLAQTVLSGGSQNANVTVKATTVSVTSGKSYTVSSLPIAVTTGLPVANGVSVSAAKLSLDGTCDGDSTTVTVRMRDRYGNPPPANYVANIVAQGAGKVSPASCSTTDPLSSTAEAGVCSVSFFVQNPRPATGRAIVLASLAGEETFTDKNANGFYDPGESFVDLPEVFEDDNQNGVYDSGEFYRDANANGVYDGPDGIFEGYVCDSPGVNCRTIPTTIGNSPTNSSPLVIIFSDRNPNVSNLSVSGDGTFAGGRFTFSAAQGFASVNLTVLDGKGNSLPSGTSFTLTTTSGTVIAPATVGPFTLSRNLSFQLQAPAAAAAGSTNSGLVTITANIPASACSGPTAATVSLFRVQSP